MISFLTRPVSLSVRLFANMLAGHTMLAVFASFVVALGAAGGILSAAVHRADAPDRRIMRWKCWSRSCKPMSSPFSPASISTKRFTSTINTERTRESFDMDLHAAKMIGAGLACIALVGAGIGIGIVFGSYLSGALRNPGAAATQTTNLLLGFALCEATGLFGLVIALIILFT